MQNHLINTGTVSFLNKKFTINQQIFNIVYVFVIHQSWLFFSFCKDNYYNVIIINYYYYNNVCYGINSVMDHNGTVAESNLQLFKFEFRFGLLRFDKSF